MSMYGFDPASRTLSVAWPTGRARRAGVVTVLPEVADVEAIDDVVMALDALSAAMWDIYVHPASQFGDPDEPNTDAWHWDRERKAFPEALTAVRSPRLPRDGGLMMSYCQVEEGGHRLGRALHALDRERTSST